MRPVLSLTVLRQAGVMFLAKRQLHHRGKCRCQRVPCWFPCVNTLGASSSSSTQSGTSAFSGRLSRPARHTGCHSGHGRVRAVALLLIIVDGSRVSTATWWSLLSRAEVPTGSHFMMTGSTGSSGCCLAFPFPVRQLPHSRHCSYRCLKQVDAHCCTLFLCLEFGVEDFVPVIFFHDQVC